MTDDDRPEPLASYPGRDAPVNSTLTHVRQSDEPSTLARLLMAG